MMVKLASKVMLSTNSSKSREFEETPPPETVAQESVPEPFVVNL